MIDALKSFIAISRLVKLSDLIPLESRLIICPFHPDTNPSAQPVYDSKNLYEAIYCYSCHKRYTSYHYIKRILQEKPLTYIQARGLMPEYQRLYDALILSDDGFSRWSLPKNFNQSFLLGSENFMDYFKRLFAVTVS